MGTAFVSHAQTAPSPSRTTPLMGLASDPRVPSAEASPPRRGPGICIPDPNAVSIRGYSEDANSMGNSLDTMQSDAARRTMEPPPSPSGYQRQSAPPQQTLVNHDVQTINTHPRTIPTRCPYTLCSSVFKGDSTVDNLKSHMFRMHPVGWKVKYHRCKLAKTGVHCPMETLYPSNRKSYSQTVHNKEVPPNPESNKLYLDLVASMFEEIERPLPTS